MWGRDQCSARNETMYRHRARTWPLWQGDALRTSSDSSYPSALQHECRFITIALGNSPRFLCTRRVVEVYFFLRLIFLKATALIAFLNTKRYASAHYFCSWRQDMFFFSLGKRAGFTFFFPPWEAMMAVRERSCWAPWGEMSPADKPHTVTLLQRLPSHI